MSRLHRNVCGLDPLAVCGATPQSGPCLCGQTIEESCSCNQPICGSKCLSRADCDEGFVCLVADCCGFQTCIPLCETPLGPGAVTPLLGPSATAFVTAPVINGAVRVVAWDLPKFLNEGNPADYRIADSGSAGPAGSSIRIVKIRGTGPPNERYVTAMKQADGTLLLVGWALGKP